MSAATDSDPVLGSLSLTGCRDAMGRQALRGKRKRTQKAGQRKTLYGRFLLCPALFLVVMLGVGCGSSSEINAASTSITLSNGIRVVAVRFPASTNVSIFTFLPMGLTTDAPDQAQWSHLIEHLVIRSTVPADSSEANAETLPDHTRLDFYGHLGNWREGLAHHRRWLEGVPFTEASLAAEKPKVIAECDFTARNFATHKFAVAAWSQGHRHGKQHVALKGDVMRAGLAEVQRLRDERLVVSNQVTVCVVSGLESKQVVAEVQKQFGSLRLHSAPVSRVNATHETTSLTWDLDARHLLITWAIPGFRHEDHAALMVAAQSLNLLLASDPQLKRQTGMSFAGADLMTPEGSFLFVSASLRPDSDAEQVRRAILGHVGRLSSDLALGVQARFIGRQLSTVLTELPETKLFKAQLASGMTMAMLEGNSGLQLGMYEHRFGAYRATLAGRLAGVSASDTQRAASAYLSEAKAAVCVLSPAKPSTDSR
ncbi:MAG: insulinase family protein [Verrucomicrobia bacterium]|nr:insulinase family protein [Verrucomicrobiota bacterium]